MIGELESYQDQLLAITQDVPGLIGHLTDQQFNWRPAPNKWSIAECFDHLNRTAAVFVPTIESTIAEARRRGLEAPGPFTHSLLERMFARVNEPPPRFRARAPRKLAPGQSTPLAPTLDAFMNWQTKMGDCIVRAEGVDLRRARAKSPVLPLFTWSLGAMFAIMLSHERRHIWQARQVRNERLFPSA
jgi:hypothetical protein